MLGLSHHDGWDGPGFRALRPDGQLARCRPRIADRRLRPSCGPSDGRRRPVSRSDRASEQVRQQRASSPVLDKAVVSVCQRAHRGGHLGHERAADGKSGERHVHAGAPVSELRRLLSRHARPAREDRARRFVPISLDARRRSMKRMLSRRMLLRGATGAALALPLLDDIPRAHAQAKSADAGASGSDAGLPLGPGGPKRLIIMYSPNGTIPSAWASTGSGANFTPRTILQPLVTAGHNSDLIAVQNLATT